MTVLRVVDIDKCFGAVRAVRKVTLAFEPGGIHAVVGENGAGKSTLLKIAAGVATPDGGHVEIDGARLSPHTAARAIARGVAMVQQHFALVPVFTALENVVLGAEPVRSLGRLDMKAARAKVEGIAKDLGVEIALDALVESLGVGDRQRLEIARALYRDARVLILDEPTAVLTPGEATALYATLRRLADAGRAVVVVTHKLDEVRDHADVVSVMRRGELARSAPFAHGQDVDAVAEAIMGGHAPPPLERARATPGAERLRVTDVAVGRALGGVSFVVHASEIVGIAGVEGNGQRELVRVLAGLDAPDAGDVRSAPLAVVHEDRHREGLVLDADLRENLMLGELANFTRWGLVDRARFEREASLRSSRASVIPPDLGAQARALSGGNQQKIVVERAMSRTARGDGVLVIAHPTRGVDFGAARAIHESIARAASRGVAVLVVSVDLGELRALCDRILVMRRGRIEAELAPSASDRAIGDAMLGSGA